MSDPTPTPPSADVARLVTRLLKIDAGFQAYVDRIMPAIKEQMPNEADAYEATMRSTDSRQAADMLTGLFAQVERLTEGLADEQQVHNTTSRQWRDQFDAMHHRAMAAEAHRDALQAALQEIADQYPERRPLPDQTTALGGYAAACANLAEIARAALQPAQQETKG